MGTGFFPSRHRSCAGCSERTVEVKGEEVAEYYHRGVVCHLIGLPLAVPLDVELMRPGEGELPAGRRLMERSVETYGRLFDVAVVDALYFNEDVVTFWLKHGKHVIATLKENNSSLLEDAKGLFTMMEPKVWREGKKTVRCWDAERFIYGKTGTIRMRVLYAEETTTKRERRGSRTVEKTVETYWSWGTTIPASVLPTRELWHFAHARWDIQNDLFETLVKHWSLNHCFKHDPTAILNFLLTLFIAYVLLQSFYQRNMKPELRSRFTLIAIAVELTIGVAAPHCVAPWVALFTGPAP